MDTISFTIEIYEPEGDALYWVKSFGCSAEKVGNGQSGGEYRVTNPIADMARLLEAGGYDDELAELRA